MQWVGIFLLGLLLGSAVCSGCGLTSSDGSAGPLGPAGKVSRPQSRHPAEREARETPEQREVRFQAWLQAFKREAIERERIRPEVCDAIIERLRFDPSVPRAYRRQPESVQTFDRYLQHVLSGEKVKVGRRHLREERDVLTRIEQKYGVDPSTVVAIWGMESFYGSRQGRYNVAQSLATLAFSGIKEGYARRELMILFKLIDGGSMTVDQLKGSWAGAMGQVQFTPSSYESYAATLDGKGRADIWSNTSDSLASIANYLRTAGRWRRGALWGVEVRSTAQISDLAKERGGLKTRLPLGVWVRDGVRPVGNQEIFPDRLPRRGLSLVCTNQEPSDRCFLVSENFSSILRYNRHLRYALAVGIMSDRIGTDNRQG